MEELERKLVGVGAVLALTEPGVPTPGNLIAPSIGLQSPSVQRAHEITLERWRTQAATRPVAAVWLDTEPVPAAARPTRGFGVVLDRNESLGDSWLHVCALGEERRTRDWHRLLEPELVSHLSRAVQLHVRRLVLEHERDTGLRIQDRIPLAILQLDARGRVRSANPAAMRLLAARDGLVIGSAGLEGADFLSALRCGRADRAPGVDEIGMPISIERPSRRRPLRALVASLDSEAAPPERTVVFVGDPDAPTQLSNRQLREFYGLTPAECALVVEFTNGRDLHEAARRLDITYGTARQRLTSIFTKTGTRRQAELVRLLLTGPEVLLGPQ